MSDQCCPMDTYDGDGRVVCSCGDGCDCMCLGCVCSAWGEEWAEPELDWRVAP